MKSREVIHPTRIRKWESKFEPEGYEPGLEFHVTGYPWWIDDPTGEVEGSIAFNFEGISDGFLDFRGFYLDPHEEDLEDLDVRPLSELEWGRGPACKIYCSSPIPDAIRFFARFHDCLVDVRCPFGPSHYLNLIDGRVSGFEQMASTKSFLLCEGPETICNAAAKLLDEERCGYQFVRGEELTPGLIWVRILDSEFVCRSAYAEF